MEYSIYSRNSSIFPLMEIVRRLIVYLPMIAHVRYCNQYYYPAFIDAIRTNKWQDLLNWAILVHLLSIVSFVLALITFKSHYVLRKIIVNKEEREVNLRFGGLLSSLGCLASNVVRYLGFRSLLQSGQPVEQRISQTTILIAFNLVSVAYSLLYNVSFKHARTLFYIKLSTFWKLVHGVLISYLFVIGIISSSNELIRIIYRLVFLFVCFKMFRFLEVTNKRLVKLNFVNKISDLKSLFLFMSAFLYFGGFQTIDFLFNGGLISPTFYEKLELDYLETLVLYIICARHNFYYEVAILFEASAYGNSQEHVLMNALFDKRAKLVIRQRSQFYRYFIERILGIMNVGINDIFNKNHSLKNGYIRNLVKESKDLEEKLINFMKSRFANVGATKGKVPLKTKVLDFLKSMAIHAVLNVHNLLKLSTQVFAMSFVYYQTLNSDMSDIERIVHTCFLFIVTYWSIFSYKLNNLISMVKFNTYIMIPTLTLNCGYSVFKFYNVKFASKTYGTSSPGFLERNSENLLIFSFFGYTLFSSIIARNLVIKNALMQAFEETKLLQADGLKHTPFGALVRAFSELFYSNFTFFILALTIFTTMLEVNLLNLFLMVFSITFLVIESSHKNYWAQYVFFLDLLILIKYYSFTQGYCLQHSQIRHLEQYRADGDNWRLHLPGLAELYPPLTQH
jgi:hypothetical protein